jgi:hypothetical protein
MTETMVSEKVAFEDFVLAGIGKVISGKRPRKVRSVFRTCGP